MLSLRSWDQGVMKLPDEPNRTDAQRGERIKLIDDQR